MELPHGVASNKLATKRRHWVGGTLSGQILLVISYATSWSLSSLIHAKIDVLWFMFWPIEKLANSKIVVIILSCRLFISCCTICRLHKNFPWNKFLLIFQRKILQLSLLKKLYPPPPPLATVCPLSNCAVWREKERERERSQRQTTAKSTLWTCLPL